MARHRSLQQRDLEAANLTAWVLLAVDRLGSFGSFEREGEALQNAGLIEPAGEKYVVTAKGEVWVQRINQARG